MAAKTMPDPICETCWPDGWPLYGTSASCDHGQWSRSDGAAGIPIETESR